MMPVRAVIAAAALLLAAACQPSGLISGAVPDDQMTLSAGNYSDRVLELIVNDVSITVLTSASSRTLTAAELPALPWHAEVRLATGRTLLEVTFESGSVRQTAHGSESPGARVDLSCGRIEMWSGYPLIGPPPGPGVPGDCDP